MKREINMTEGNPTSLLLRFAIPLMIGNIFQQLYIVTDSIIVGQGVGMDALAALGTTDWVNMLALGVAQGFTQGFSVKVAQKYGEGDATGMRKTIGSAVRLTIFITLLTALIGQLFLPLILTVLRVPPELYGMAETYARLYYAGIPAMMVYNLASGILRAVGNSQTPLYALLVAAGINISLDCLFVFGLEWGVTGAAIATIIAQFCAGIVCVVKMRKTPILHFSPRDMRRNKELGRQMLQIGFPVSIQYTVAAIGGILSQSVVNGFGAVFMAGFAASNKMYGLVDIAAMAYSSAVTTYVGQNYGAGKPDRIRQGLRSARNICIVTSVLLGIFLILFAKPMIAAFIRADTPELQAEASAVALRFLMVIGGFMVVFYIMNLFRSALLGMGDTIFPTYSGVLELVLRVGTALLAEFFLGETCLYFSELITWTGCFIFAWFLYRYKMPRIQFPSPVTETND